MFTQKQKVSFTKLIKTGNNIAGCFLLVIWLLVFFTSPLKLRANKIGSHTYKTEISVSATSTAHQDVPYSPNDPLPIPEDPEEVSEIENNIDADKKAAITAFIINLLSIAEIQSVESVRSFHFNQAIQQRLVIPLFVLHHSWKSYLI
ncbi:MAG: hypothetical protein IBJ16_06430 [Chitinophagaceae bacterium]|nr:hypothetical protein [Chitinophagaceae bacterium]